MKKYLFLVLFLNLLLNTFSRVNSWSFNLIEDKRRLFISFELKKKESNSRKLKIELTLFTSFVVRLRRSLL
jgi:hypothetical protein